ncbi:ABC transporter substrate-binding protein [Streptomyces sp. NPDC015127]|uniref:ABC transporter substrate-binding protein n=1 Tax=Streptomyces sp. NPDC015127 TaxID=3364939 RepID=UPI0036F9A57F
MKDVRIGRRAFLRGAGGVAAGAAATSITACGDRADRKTKGVRNTRTLVVRDIGGTYGEANRKAVYEPFSKETGIQVEVVNIPLYAQMLAQIKEGRPQFDVIDIEMSALARFKGEKATQALDYDRLKNTRNASIATFLLTSHSVGKNYWASLMAYRTDAFGGRTPESWADFWDTGAFPGSRAMQGPDAGPPELEFALLADGVPPDRLYPLDIDRAFGALDEIKGAVREFWADGASPGLLLERRQVAASTVWHGRLDELIKQGAPLAYQWNGARRQSSGFGIPNGAANVDAAYQLIDFALRPEVQAGFARIYPMGPVVPSAYAYLSKATATNLPSTPGHLLSGFDLDVEWWIKNRDSVTKRWQEWVNT